SVDIRRAAFAQTSQAFAFAGTRISRRRAPMMPEQEKADHKFRALDPSLRQPNNNEERHEEDAEHHPHSSVLARGTKLSASICAFSVPFVLTCRSGSLRVSFRL